MDLSEYRRQYESEISRTAATETSFRDLVQQHDLGVAAASSDQVAVTAPDADDIEEAVAYLQGADPSDELRSAALQALSLGVEQDGDIITALIDIVTNTQLPVDTRLAVLGTLQELSFRVDTFAPKRPAYLSALRGLITDPDASFRRRVIGILAREKDEYVQRKLVEGLDGTAKPLVPASKAIQFLGYDIHADYFPLIRKMAEEGPSRAARIEAIYALAADPSADKLLTKLLRDKDEHTSIRQACATALETIAPAKADSYAREIVLADDEDEQLRAASLSALTQLRNTASLVNDHALVRHMSKLRSESASKEFEQAVSDYFEKIER